MYVTCSVSLDYLVCAALYAIAELCWPMAVSGGCPGWTRGRGPVASEKGSPQTSTLSMVCAHPCLASPTVSRAQLGCLSPLTYVPSLASPRPIIMVTCAQPRLTSPLVCAQGCLTSSLPHLPSRINMLASSSPNTMCAALKRLNKYDRG